MKEKMNSAIEVPTKREAFLFNRFVFDLPWRSSFGATLPKIKSPYLILRIVPCAVASARQSASHAKLSWL